MRRRPERSGEVSIALGRLLSRGVTPDFGQSCSHEAVVGSPDDEFRAMTTCGVEVETCEELFVNSQDGGN